jgi:hypothetical protein
MMRLIFAETPDWVHPYQRKYGALVQPKLVVRLEASQQVKPRNSAGGLVAEAPNPMMRLIFAETPDWVHSYQREYGALVQPKLVVRLEASQQVKPRDSPPNCI